MPATWRFRRHGGFEKVIRLIAHANEARLVGLGGMLVVQQALIDLNGGQSLSVVAAECRFSSKPEQ
ncbi:hypothetical protein LZC95_02715 [Pendulispora brunnea]|uniref:Uncharacterized protein n=1 Tax=Pendulispora brunnea TaxID=2905690 RepID=A0ABZ2KE15_9BACT